MKVVSDGILSETKDDSHVPVLVEELLGYLQCRPGGRYLDCTVGYGGVATRLLELSRPDGLLIGIDRDPEAVTFSRARVRPFGERAQVVHGNFSDLKRHVASAGLSAVDGVVFDLGVSSPQVDQPRRGFSFQGDGPLDMRMDPSGGPTAADLLHHAAGERGSCFPDRGVRRRRALPGVLGRPGTAG